MVEPVRRLNARTLPPRSPVTMKGLPPLDTTTGDDVEMSAWLVTGRAHDSENETALSPVRSDRSMGVAVAVAPPATVAMRPADAAMARARMDRDMTGEAPGTAGCSHRPMRGPHEAS